MLLLWWSKIVRNHVEVLFCVTFTPCNTKEKNFFDKKFSFKTVAFQEKIKTLAEILTLFFFLLNMHINDKNAAWNPEILSTDGHGKDTGKFPPKLLASHFFLLAEVFPVS